MKHLLLIFALFLSISVEAQLSTVKNIEYSMQLAANYYEQQKYTESIGLLKATFKESDAIGYRGGMAKSLHQLALNNIASGEYLAARSDLENSIEIYKSIIYKDENNNKLIIHLLGRAYSDLAIIYELFGNPDKAINYYLNALEIFNNNSWYLDASIVNHNLATLYRNKKEFDIALNYCRKALTYQEENDKIQEVAISYNTLGSILYWEALVNLRKDKNPKKNFKVAESLFEEANSLLDEYRNHQSKINDNYDQGITYQNLGALKLAEYNLDAACLYLKEAQKLLKTSKNQRVRSLNILALTYYAKNNKQKSLSTIQKGLKLLSFDLDKHNNPKPEWTLAPDLTALLLSDKGRICEAYGNSSIETNKKAAIKDLVKAFYAYKACALIKKSYCMKDYSMIYLTNLEQDIHIFDKVIDLAIRLYDLTNEKIYLEEAIEYSDMEKSIEFLGYFKQFEGNEMSEVTQAFTLVDELKANFTSGSNHSIGLFNNIFNLLRFKGSNSNISHEQILKNLFSSISKKTLTDSPTVESFKSTLSLKNNEIVLNYLVTHDNLYIITLNSKGEIEYLKRESRGRVYLCEHLNKLQIMLNNEIDQTKELDTLLNEFYHTLIPTEIIKKYSILTIIPDEMIGDIPFQCLMDENGDYLVCNHNIRYLSSYSMASKIEENLTHDNNTNNFFTLNKSQTEEYNKCINDSVEHIISSYVEYNEPFRISINWNRIKKILSSETEPYKKLQTFYKENTRERFNANKTYLYALASNPFDDLGFIKDEIDSIGQFFDIVQIDSCEQSIKNRNSTIRSPFLHIATHFDIKASRGLSSALYFCEAGTPEIEDGRLTIEEISQLNLKGTYLVSLSTCSSSKNINNNDNYISLPYWFILAGATSCVSSQWDVQDQNTVKFMTCFYRKLIQENKSPMVALCESQRELLHNMLIKNWSPFIYIGNTF